MFSKSTYCNRRKRLSKDVDKGILLFLGNDETGMSYEDNTYHYRQDSTLLYFFGLNRSGLSAIIDLDEDKEIIFGDDYTIDSIVWMGPQTTIKSMADEVGVAHSAETKSLKEYLSKAVAKGRKIHILPQYRAEHQIKILDLLNIAPQQQREYVSNEFVKAIVSQRIYKSAEEIVEIEKACDITSDMHIAAIKFARPGMREAEIAAEMHKIAIAGGGNLSFPIIATKNGQTLHNHYHGNVINDGDMVLVDAGAETESCYAGDMSSTFPVSRKFTTKQREIYEIALSAHNAAIDALKPGIPFRDVHVLACRKIAEGMKDLGFMKGNIENAVEAGAHAMFFPCGLGHMMGMDVHDMENLGEVCVGYDGKPKSTTFGYKSLRLARKLEPGFVLTIEPGIYFIPDLIDQWRSEKRFSEFLNYDKIDSYRDFGGCRNEEDFLITEDGHRLLGREVPKSVKDVEALREY